MKTNKHLKLDQARIDLARRILRTRTETDTIHQALDRVIEAEEERSRKRRLFRKMIQLKKEIGLIPESTSQWLHWARSERIGKRRHLS